MEKYKDLVLMFYNKYKSSYITCINAVYIYYTPHVFEAIKNIFVKICPFSNSFRIVPVLYSNKESSIKLNELLQSDKYVSNLSKINENFEEFHENIAYL